MKICVLTDAWKPVWGGGQEHIWQIYTRLAKQGYEIDVVVPNLTDQSGKNYPGVEKFGNLRVIRIGPKYIFPNLLGRLEFLISNFKFLISNSYDLYHSHSPSTSLFLWLLKLQGKKIAITLHGAGKKMLGGGILNKLKILEVLNNLIIYSVPYDILFSAASSTIEKKPNAKNVVIVGNGVNVEDFDHVKSVHNHKSFKIIWVGRKEDPVKGVKFLEEAYEILKKKYPNISLNIVSSKYGQEKIKEYKSSDIFVLPSLSEGFPLVLLEAMAAKLPIVATDVGDCKKIIDRAQCGITVPPGSAALLANGIETIHKNKNQGKMGQHGYNFVKKHNIWQKVLGRVILQYKTI